MLKQFFEAMVYWEIYILPTYFTHSNHQNTKYSIFLPSWVKPEERSYRSTTPLAKASANWQIFRVLAIYVWEKGGTA